jgi:2'-5' RNA ligase
MTEYAVCLYFDDNTTEKLLELMRTAADACGSLYMLDPKLIPPHITICYFSADDINAAKEVIANKVAAIKRGDVAWPSLGAFIPSVLFAAPTLNQYLTDLCVSFNSRLEAVVTLTEYYRPFKWMPHTTLATKLTAEQLYKAFSAVAAKFKPFGGTAVALSLASCEPFTELQAWKLEV